MDWDVRPLEGVGPLVLGVDVDTIRAQLEGVEGFAGFAPITENFAKFDDGMSVQFFVAGDAVEAIEVWYPTSGDTSVSLDGVALFGLTRREVEAEPRLAARDFTWNGGGLISRAHSVALTIEDVRVVAVLVGVEGYYDYLDDLDPPPFPDR